MFGFLFYVAMAGIMTYLGTFFTPHMPEYMTLGKFMTYSFYCIYLFLCLVGGLHSLYRAYTNK